MGPFSPSKGYVLETAGMIVHSGAKYEIKSGLDYKCYQVGLFATSLK